MDNVLPDAIAKALATLEGDQRRFALPQFRESEMNLCSCCHPIRTRTIESVNIHGIQRFTCPKTRITMQWSEGAKTYIAGHITSGGNEKISLVLP